MVILNGRAFLDKGIGKTTCKDRSVVDYAICSIMLVHLLTHFDVLDYCPLYSDAHNAIEIHINITHAPNDKSKNKKKKLVKSSEE